MRFKIVMSFITLILCAASLSAAPTVNPSADFTLSDSSHVPGVTLKPGSYHIQVVNHLSDRVVLRVNDSKGKIQATFLGVLNEALEKPAASGPVTWANPAGNASYLKGWYFADSPAVVEFVYPKAEAVSIATTNPSKVPAVDPASEGKPADNSLAKSDMQVLTLWLLSLQEVGPGAPAGGIKAERYQLTSAPVYKPAIKALPHTASLIPIVWSVGFGLLLAAGFLRWSQRMQRAGRLLESSPGKE